MRFIKSPYTEEQEKEITNLISTTLGDYVSTDYITVNHGNVCVNKCMPKTVSAKMFKDFKEHFDKTAYSDLKLAILC